MDKSKVSRNNILNNQLAISELQDSIDTPGIVVDGEYYITTRQVEDYLEVTTRTIDQVINNHRQEIEENGYKILSSDELSRLKSAEGTEKKFGTLDYVSRLAIFNFKAFLNVGTALGFVALAVFSGEHFTNNWLVYGVIRSANVITTFLRPTESF